MDNVNLQFDVVLKSNIKIPQKATNLLNSSKRHKEAGLIRAGQKLELEAAFEACNPQHISIYHKENCDTRIKRTKTKWMSNDVGHDCYNKYIFTMEVSPLAEYPDCVPQDILDKLIKINKDYYTRLYIIDLIKKMPGQDEIALAQMNGIESHVLDIVPPIEKSELDPILLYKFDYGEYYMELARWD